MADRRGEILTPLTRIANIYGRDIFSFLLGVDGNLYPVGGVDYALFWTTEEPLASNSFYWRNNSGFCGNPNSSNIDGTGGEGCAARIMEEGWKMNY